MQTFQVETQSKAIQKSHHNLTFTLQHDYKFKKALAEKIAENADILCYQKPINQNGLDEEIVTLALQYKHAIFYLGINPREKIQNIVYKFHHIVIHTDQIPHLLLQFKGKPQSDHKDPHPNDEQIDFSNCFFENIHTLETLVSNILSDKSLGKQIKVIHFESALINLPRDKARHQLIRLMQAYPHIEILGSEVDLTQNPSVRFFLAGKSIESVSEAKKFYNEKILPQENRIERRMDVKDERFIADLKNFLKLLEVISNDLPGHLENLNYVLNAEPCHLVPRDKDLLTFFKNELIALPKWVTKHAETTQNKIFIESRKLAITSEQKAVFLADQARSEAPLGTAETFKTFSGISFAFISKPPTDYKKLTACPTPSTIAASCSTQTRSSNSLAKSFQSTSAQSTPAIVARKSAQKSTFNRTPLRLPSPRTRASPTSAPPSKVIGRGILQSPPRLYQGKTSSFKSAKSPLTQPHSASIFGIRPKVKAAIEQSAPKLTLKPLRTIRATKPS